MFAGFAGLAVALGLVVLSVVVKRVGDTIRWGVDTCHSDCGQLLESLSQGSGREPAASSQLVERLEAVERRVDLALQDLNTQLRRLGQRRRQLLGAEGEEPAQEELELAHQLQSSRSTLPTSEPSSNGRSGRLVRRR